MTWAELLVSAVAAYALVGIIFAFAFVTRGVGVVDADARGAPVGFRVLIFPASAALWPLLTRRWLAAKRTHNASSKEPTDVV